MQQPRQYRYFEFVMVGFVVVLVCSNLVGPAKEAQVDLPLIGAVTFGAGVLFFPISYVFGDILTEVYGYSRARRVIWSGFAALLFAAVMAAVVVALPPAPEGGGRAARRDWSIRRAPPSGIVPIRAGSKSGRSRVSTYCVERGSRSPRTTACGWIGWAKRSVGTNTQARGSSRRALMVAVAAPPWTTGWFQ